MKKFVAASAALMMAGLLAWPGASAFALSAPVPVPTPPRVCFANWLSCLAEATQDLACCIDPGAQGCKVDFTAPATSDYLRGMSCRSQYRDDVNQCDDGLFNCLFGAPGPMQ
jgi:hypothetical protein